MIRLRSPTSPLKAPVRLQPEPASSPAVADYYYCYRIWGLGFSLGIRGSGFRLSAWLLTVSLVILLPLLLLAPPERKRAKNAYLADLLDVGRMARTTPSKCFEGLK